jgi:membrane associated rhomboid family serine protease
MVQPHDEPTAIQPEDPDRDGRAPAREPVFNIPAVVVALIALCVGIHAARLYVLDLNQDLELLVRAAFIPVRYSGDYSLDVYAFTSPVTYSLLHGSIPHLVINAIWLAAFGAPLAVRIGPLRFLAFWIATAVAAAALHYVLHATDNAPLVGASGAISGMMGAAARFGFRVDRRPGGAGFAGPILPVAHVLRMRGVLTFLAVWMGVNLVTGLAGFMPGDESRIAWEAHIGGFLAGFLGVRCFDRPKPYR